MTAIRQRVAKARSLRTSKRTLLSRMPEIRPAAYDSKIEGNVIFTRLDAAINWMRKNSLWPMPMGLACCAIELMATAASRFDISRFGAEVMRFSPRQCDVMIVAGTVTYKMALAVILHRLSWFGFLEFLFFVVILAIAYVYIWRKGALDWQ